MANSKIYRWFRLFFPSDWPAVVKLFVIVEVLLLLAYLAFLLGVEIL